MKPPPIKGALADKGGSIGRSPSMLMRSPFGEVTVLKLLVLIWLSAESGVSVCGVNRLLGKGRRPTFPGGDIVVGSWLDRKVSGGDASPSTPSGDGSVIG